ncbi:MAG: hypothetical protein HY064_16640 [Bacteroidetes bacterium]|nr:hypothetical protein [Bacteroidota bacterium]
MKLISKTFFAGTLSLFSILHAQDRQYVWTYQCTTLPKGAKDLEAWSTWSYGRNYFYQRLDTRLEMEVGLTDRIQSAFYFNASHAAFGANLDTLGGIANTNVDGIFHSSEFSFSNEWKWRLTDATAPIGFTLYAEYGLAPGKFELENKLIFDKKFPKDNFALNLVNETEIYYSSKKGKTIRSTEYEPELDLAYMHMLKPAWGLGLEMRNSNEIENGNWNFSAIMGGPTLFYAGSGHFIIIGFMPQWMNLHKTDDAPNNLVLNAREKYAVRMLFGFGL